MTSLLELTGSGLYCAEGDFYIDPWRPVKRAVVTHAHGDHLSGGSRAYLVAQPGEGIFRLRLGMGAPIRAVPYGERVDVNGVTVSLHPAGHILGSAQVRVERGGEVWVASGDYKRQPDPTCAPFEVVPCHTFITEATFGLPIYRWPDPAEEFERINDWWRANQQAGKASVVYAYVLGKAQRVLAGVDASIGPIYTHGMVERINAVYRAAGVPLPPTEQAVTARSPDFSRALVLAPISARATPWMRRFGAHASSFASGWMRIRGTRRRRAVDRGFVLSDHVDWPDLLATIDQTGAEDVWVTHGYTSVVSRWLAERGRRTQALQTHFEGEEDIALPEEGEAEAQQ